jgi:hypothetical protein
MLFEKVDMDIPKKKEKCLIVAFKHEITVFKLDVLMDCL